MVVIGRLIINSFLSNESLTRCAVVVCRRSVGTLNVKQNITDKNATAQSKRVPLEEAVKEKEIEIRTCGQLYEKWRREKRYWSIAKSELTFKVKYIDTDAQGDGLNKPTVLSLHGSPGSYKDFDPLTSHLYERGVRVIAPNFQGSDIPPKVFRNCPEEKSEYVKDFLQTLRIPRVDMLVCHSSALFPGLVLSLENRTFSPKSLVLLNPTALEVPRLLRPAWLLYGLVRLYEFPMAQQIVHLCAKRIASKPELKKGTVEEHLLSAVTLLNSHIPKQAIPFQSLLNQNYPIMMAYSENDKLIAKESSFKMARMMVDKEDILSHDQEGKVKNQGGKNPFRKVMAFENGSHFLLKTNPGIVCDAVSSFLFRHLENRAN